MRIEFILTSAMEVPHFAPIVHALRALDQEAVFVLPRSVIEGKTPFGFDDFETIRAAVEPLKVPWGHVDLENTDAAVTTFPTTYVNYRRAKTFRMMYGASVIADVSDHPMGKESDFYLVHGPLGRKIQFKHHGLPSPMIPDERVKVIGYPKLDGWWSRFPDLRFSQKRLVLWLPTWSTRSSIDRYVVTIADLQLKYEVWTKPHHCAEKWEPERFEKLITLFNLGPWSDTTASQGLYSAADLILADLSSGAFAEALLTGKPVVGLTNPEEHQRSLIDLDYLPTCTDPQWLSLVIEEALKDDWTDLHLDNIRNQLFTTTKGHDGELAARTILECLA